MTKSTRYEYSCASCESPVEKSPTGQSEGKGGGHGLHGWQCMGACGRGVKVTRRLK